MKQMIWWIRQMMEDEADDMVDEADDIVDEADGGW